MSKKNSDAGLTILELMIVLVILSLVGVVATIQVTRQLDRAKTDIVKLQLRNLENTLELFRLDVRQYPTNEQGLEVLLVNEDSLEGWRGPYLKNQDILIDPWGTGIIYRFSDNGQFEVKSLGSDRKEGGEGVNIDITLAGGK